MNRERSFNSTAARHNSLRLEDTLDDAQSIVHRALHLVQHEVVGTSQNDRGCTAGLGLSDDDELIVADTLLDDLLGWRKAVNSVRIAS